MSTPHPYGTAPASGPARRRAPRPNPGTRTIIAIVGGGLGLAMLVAATVAASHGSAVFPAQDLDGSFAAGGITRIDVSTGSMDVEIVPIDGEEIAWSAHVSSYPGATPPSQVATQSGGTVQFRFGRTGWNWWPSLRLGPPPNDDSLRIEVPRDLVPDLVLSTGVGDTSVDGVFATVSVDGGVGDLHLAGTASALKLDLGVGDLTSVMDVDGGPVTVDSGVGNTFVDLGTTRAPGPITVIGGVGDVTVLLPTLTLGYNVSTDAGIGGVQNNSPSAVPGGVPVDIQVPVIIEGGVGSVTVGASAR